MTWLLLPPVAMMTAFLALTFTVLIVMAMTPSDRNGCIGVELPGSNFGV